MHADSAAVQVRHLREALELAEERFLATFELAPVGVAHVAPDGRWLRVNPRLCELLGYECDELVGLRFQDTTHPEDLAADLDEALRTLAGEQSEYRIEKRYVHKDGTAVWAEVQVALVREKATEKPLYFVAVIDDITEQRRAERALERHAHELQTLLERLPDIVTRFDREGRHLYVNPAVERATGRPAEEFIGRTNRELGMPLDLVEEWEGIQQEVVERDEPRELHFTFPSPDGPQQFWTRMVPEHHEDGRVVGVLAVARNLTRAEALGAELEQAIRTQVETWSDQTAEAALHESEARFRAIFEHAAVGMAQVGLDGDWIRVNDRLCEIVGYSREELLRRTFQDITHRDDLAEDLEHARRLVDGETEAYAMRKRYVRKDGETVWVNLTVSLVRDGRDRPLHFVSVVEDVSDRVLAEQRVAESEERFRFLAELIPHLVWSTRPDGYHDYYNQRWFEYTGLTYEDTKGPGWNEVLHPDDRERAWERWRRSLESGEPYSIEYRFRRHDGEYRWFLGLALPLVRDGAIERWFGTCTDIQDLKDAEAALRESERELREARETAERANRRKSEFVAAMAHEMRTPLNAVIGYADLLGAGVHAPLLESQQKLVDRIEAAADHLRTLVDETLDLARIEAGEMRVAREPLHVEAVVEEAVVIVEPMLREAAHDLAREGLDGAHPEVRGDAGHFRQILVNLLGNAAKFTDDGGAITVRCRIADAGPAGTGQAPHPGPGGWNPTAWLAIDVEDTGVGIASEHQERIFEPFAQAEGRIEGRSRGTGLGLAISRTLARLMDGDLTVESTPGEGSRFTLWLPAALD